MESSEITFIIKGKELTISRELVNKSDLLDGLIDIQKDKIELVGISYDLLQLLVYLLQNNINIKLELSKLYEFMSFHSNGAYNNLCSYCLEHRCAHNEYCRYSRIDNYQYCINHKCFIKGCNNNRERHNCKN